MNGREDEAVTGFCIVRCACSAKINLAAVIVEACQSAGGIAATWDDNGNLLSDGTAT